MMTATATTRIKIKMTKTMNGLSKVGRIGTVIMTLPSITKLTHHHHG